jgi:uncharacterized membrane protein
LSDRPSETVRPRLASIDLVRGIVMVLMALEHVRVFVGHPGFDPTDLGRTTPGWFLTRWITHFCAPTFVFLAGTGAFLRGATAGSATLPRYLAVRGAWLVLLEATLVRFGWTFNFDYGHFLFGGVIWVIGWCLILLAAVVRFPAAVAAACGAVVVVGQHVLPRLPSATGPEGLGRAIWRVLYQGGRIDLWGASNLIVLYTIVPWIGVMLLGYAFGAVMRLPEPRRRRLCFTIGGSAIAAFIVLRGLGICGGGSPWEAQPTPLLTALSFLNTQKYPASLQFLLMTLGPAILAIPWAELARGAIATKLALFGRVPLFYYLLHVPLIHLGAALLSVVQLGRLDPWLRANHPMMAFPPPEGFGLPLAGVWIATAIVVIALYPACRAFAEVKSRRRGGWLELL